MGSKPSSTGETSLGVQVVDGIIGNESGAGDVIVIRLPTGQLKSTPFAVRFQHSKAGEEVRLTVGGGSESQVTMTMRSDGMAVWNTTKAAAAPLTASAQGLLEPENSSTDAEMYDQYVMIHKAKAEPTDEYDSGQVPSAEQLQSLNLKDGENKISFTHNAKMVTGRIFLWNHNDKLIISDWDGTVTKTDKRGEILGALWLQPNLCQLYSSFVNKGYKVVYLTARGVTLTAHTRKNLEDAKQDSFTLPNGPILTAPVKFFQAAAQELAKKAYEFKIGCLTYLQNAFREKTTDTTQPFYAGWGNRIGDVTSYLKMGIPFDHIYFVDPDGNVKVNAVVTNRSQLVTDDARFPPLGK